MYKHFLCIKKFNCFEKEENKEEGMFKRIQGNNIEPDSEEKVKDAIGE